MILIILNVYLKVPKRTIQLYTNKPRTATVEASLKIPVGGVLDVFNSYGLFKECLYTKGAIRGISIFRRPSRSVFWRIVAESAHA